MLSFQEQTSKDQIKVPWDKSSSAHSIPSPTIAPGALSCKRAAMDQAPLRSGAASVELQLKWFSKESGRGNPNQLFPSSQQ